MQLSKKLLNQGDTTVDLTQGLVAHYLLNNNADDSHGTYDGTPVGGVDFQGDVASFDGLNSAVNVAENIFNGMTSFTISFWSKLDSISSDKAVIAKWADAPTNILLYHDAPLGWRLLIVTGAGTTGLQSSAVATVGELQHVVFSWVSGGTFKIYINGVFIEESTVTVASSIITDTDNTFQIGADNLTRDFTGFLSNIRIYNEAKDQAFITALFEEGYYPKPLPLPTTTGLVAHYPLTGTAEDAHGQGGNESGIEYNGVSFVSDVDRGSVASFDGVNDYIKFPNGIEPLIGGSSTISIRAKCNTLGTLQRIFIINSVTSNAFISLSFGTDNTIQFYVHGSTPISIKTGTISADTYYNITITFDGTVGTLYVDNVFVGSSSVIGLSKVDTVSGDVALLGMGRDLSTYPLNGKCSDLYLYERILTSTEITALFNEVDEPTYGLIAHYPLTIEWRTGDAWVAYDGTEVGNIYVDGAEFGSVATFDGVNDYLTIPNNSAFNSQNSSISFWFYSNYAGTSLKGLVHKAPNTDANTNQFGIYLNGADGRLYINVSNGAVNYSIASLLAEPSVFGAWHHAVLIKEYGASNDTLHLYMDGVYANSSTMAGHGYINTSPIVVGKLTSISASDRYLLGSISDLRFYNSVLTATEITDIYNYEKNFRPIDIDDGLVAYYPLADNSLDNYYNEHDGTDTSMTYDGLSAVFNGTNGYINPNINHFSSSSTVRTISMWMKAGTYNFGANGGVNTYAIVGRYAVIYGDVESSNDNFPLRNFIDSTVWQHVVVVFKGASVGFEVYLEGVLIYTSAPTSFIGCPYTQYIGVRNTYNTPANFTACNNAKLRIYNKALTAEQVAVIYNTEKGDFI